MDSNMKLGFQQQIGRSQIRTYLITLFIILLSGAWGVFKNSYLLNYVFSLGIVLWALSSRIKQGRTRVNGQRTVLLLLFNALQMLIIFSSSKVNSGIYSLLIFNASLCIPEVLSFTDFKKCFTDIMVVYAPISLICYALQSSLLNNIYQYFPQTEHGVRNAYQMFIYYYIPNDFLRNRGMFWEPGAYQVFLLVALYFETFSKSKKLNYLRILILLIAAVSTFSTTGLFALMIYLVVLNVADGKRNNAKYKKYIFIMLTICVVGLFISSNIDTIERALFGKFDFSSQGKGSINFMSRWNSIIADFNIMIKYPLGCSLSNYDTLLRRFVSDHNLQFDASACTYTIIGASFGIVVMFVCIYRIWLIVRNGFGTKLGKLLMLMYFILIFSTESFVEYFLFYALCAYGVNMDCSKESNVI